MKKRNCKRVTKETSLNQNTRDRKGVPSIFIIRDRMSKKLNGYLLTKKKNMEVLLKYDPSPLQKSVVCRSTSNLLLETYLIDLSRSLKKNEITITVSGIVPRLDELNNKTTKVNTAWNWCASKEVYHIYIDPTVKPLIPISIWMKVIFTSIFMGFEILQNFFQIFCSSLIDINLRWSQKIRNQIG